MSSSMQSSVARLDLITRNLPECPGRDEIKAILDEGRNPKGMWITVPTGRPHLGYFVPFLKMVDFLRAGAELTICLGDLYAFFINFKYPIEQVMQRKVFYKSVFSAVLETMGIPLSKIRFMDESDYALTEKHVWDHVRLCGFASQHDIRLTGDEVGKSTMFGPMLTPGLQALDEEYTGSDFALGGIDQRGLFSFAEHYLPKLNYKKRAHLMNDMLIGLNGGKMSASLPDSKIDCLDSPETVTQKISAVFCEEGEVHENGLLAIMRLVLVPVSRLRVERVKGQVGVNLEEGQGDFGDQRPFCSADAPAETVFSIKLGKAEGAEIRHYSSYEEIERDYAHKHLRSEHLKEAVADGLISLLAHVRKSYSNNPKWQTAAEIGYPETEEEFISTHGAGKMTSAESVSQATTTDYDMNFCLPLHLLSNDHVKLVPFNPPIHANAIWRNSISQEAALWAHMTPGPFTCERDLVEQFVRDTIQVDRGAATFAIIDKRRRGTKEDPEGMLAGIVSYLNTSPAKKSTEIGYLVILPTFQQTDVAINAVNLMLQHAFEQPSSASSGGLGLRRVAWQVSATDAATAHLVETMGFQKEGVLRWNVVYDDAVTRGKVGKVMHDDEGDDHHHHPNGVQQNGVQQNDVQHNGLLNGVSNEQKSSSSATVYGDDTVVYGLTWHDWRRGGVAIRKEENTAHDAAPIKASPEGKLHDPAAPAAPLDRASAAAIVSNGV